MLRIFWLFFWDRSGVLRISKFVNMRHAWIFFRYHVCMSKSAYNVIQEKW